MKNLNDGLKLMTGTREQGPEWVSFFQKNYRKLTSKISKKTQEKGNLHGINVFQVISAIFSVIGLISTLQFFWSVVTSSSKDKMVSHDPTKECRVGDEETCPWFMVFTRLTDKLKSLENELSDQILIRESIERDMMNQSDLNMVLNEKLKSYFEKLDNVSVYCDRIESLVVAVHSRLFFVELILYFIFMVILYEIYTAVRPHTHQWRETIQIFIDKYILKKELPPLCNCEMDGIVPTEEEKEDESEKEIILNGISKEEKDKRVGADNSIPTQTAPSTPKHGVLRKEMCVVLFRKECLSIYSTVVETLLTYFTEIKIASAPYYVIENFNDISKIPHVKLFILVCDNNCNYGSGARDLRVATLKVLKTWGAVPIIVIGNDEESKRLTGHTQYNGNLRFVFSNELVQDHASAGRVFSIWKDMSPHQMSHLRKLIKPILTDAKPISNLRYITLTK